MDVEDSREKKEIMNPNIFLSPEEGFFGGGVGSGIEIKSSDA